MSTKQVNKLGKEKFYIYRKTTKFSLKIHQEKQDK